MATITLYKDKLNGVGGLIDTMIKSVNDLDVQLGALKSTLQGVDSSTYNLQDTVDSIRSSSKAEKEKIEDLKKLNRKVNEFITTTVKRDNSARDEINKAKKDFYTKYSYLKPECEKSTLEKIVDTLESAGEWCAKHWKLIATVIIVVVAVALLFVPGVNAIVVGACWGAIFGAVIGGVSGGLESMSQGGSFWDGFEDGAFSGAVGGAIGGAAFAGLGMLGTTLGNSMHIAYKGMECTYTFGKVIKGTAAVSKVLSMGMSGFDTLALIDMAIDNKNNPIADLNRKLHSSKAYNMFQTGVSALSVLTGAMTNSMTCFVAGTMVLTSAGLVAIEKIRAGDKVFSVNPDTMERAHKNVLETYVREVKELVHLMIAGEEIVTTVDHPFYVNGRGFINAVNLCIGTELINSGGDVIKVEQIYREKLDDETVRVYNFKVEDYHTYYIGETCIWVHNAGDTYSRPSHFRKGVRDKAWENAKDKDGLVIDPVTKKTMDPSSAWDMGHKPGYEFRKHQASARARGISRKQFLDEYNDPSHYRPELPSSNRSHVGEDLTDLYYGP